ncbi:MAG TPA: restriction endonuclease [Bellilinea sp.]|nr:restriction endonuclease [Bellilinea sp.]
MARRERTSPLEDIITLSSKLPWWVCLILALVSYGVLHAIASRPAPAVTNPAQFGSAIAGTVITTFAFFGQLVLPMAFGFGAVISGINTFREKKVFEKTAARKGVGSLNEMSWADFERLVSEFYRRKGFQVSREGGNGPDGGIDLVLKQKGETYLVQCKQWKAYKVGVQPVREFYGVMSAKGAAGGYFVTSGEYTDEAKRFVQGLNLELVDGIKLRKMIDSIDSPQTADSYKNPPLQSVPSSNSGSTPACPSCGGEMKKRVARHGANAGKEFWGCASYPKCKGVRAHEETVPPTVTAPQEVPTPTIPETKSCPQCGSEMKLRQFQSGPRAGERFYGCVPCKKGWPVDQSLS